MSAVVTVKLRMLKEQRMLRKERLLKKLRELRMSYLTKLKNTQKADMSGKPKTMSLRETFLLFQESGK